MEPLWSPVVATGSNHSQIASPQNRHKQAKIVAVGCDQLPRRAHGKEGVDGSSPSEAGGSRRARSRRRIRRHPSSPASCLCAPPRPRPRAERRTRDPAHPRESAPCPQGGRSRPQSRRLGRVRSSTDLRTAVHPRSSRPSWRCARGPAWDESNGAGDWLREGPQSDVDRALTRPCGFSARRSGTKRSCSICSRADLNAVSFAGSSPVAPAVYTSSLRSGSGVADARSEEKSRTSSAREWMLSLR